ncbi:MAG TPA: ATP synthase subunit I [Pseudomonadales bacterium]|nr:ATP synthase subunit I [Pseudomonadales bacterium]
MAFRVVAVQGVLAVTLTMMFLLFSRAHALSCALAGAVMLVPNMYFAWRVAVDVPAGQESSAARRLLGSGIAKSLATIGLLIAVFAYFRPQPLAFFATMIVLQGVYWFAPFFDLDVRFDSDVRRDGH